jgi:predicted alpha-1,2-mannosidase
LRFKNRSISYRKLFDKESKFIRPRNQDGSWYEPFNPLAGANFEKNVGYIEGNAWQYAFMVPHDIHGLIKQMGGKKAFVNRLQELFDKGHFDMANEPDIAYPFLFNYVKGEEWRSQKIVRELVDQYFQNKSSGIPGNDDTGTMSVWLVYAMMGLYPVAPGIPNYTLTVPIFDKITIQLDSNYYKNKQLVIEKAGNSNGFINKIQLDGKTHKSYFISHEDLVNGNVLKINLK